MSDLRGDFSVDVLGLGAVAVDDLLYVDAYPSLDAKAPVRDRRRELGGLAGTALVAVTRLGGRAAYAGALGHGELARWAFDRLAAERVDVAHVIDLPDAQPIHSTIVVSPGGARALFFDRHGVLGAAPDGPDETVIRGTNVLLVDNVGVPGMVRAARISRSAGIPVVGDFESGQDPLTEELLALTSHLILSASFAEEVTGLADPAAMAERLWTSNRRAVAITCGSRGLWHRSAGTGPIHLPAFPVQAVDSTGCGDVFHGAYALALARGLDLHDRLCIAAAAAAIKATRPGGQTGIPDGETLVSFLTSHGKRETAHRFRTSPRQN